MLVLSRRLGEEIVIGGNVHVRIVKIDGNQVRLGITAPRCISVHRAEVEARRSFELESQAEVETLVSENV